MKMHNFLIFVLCIMVSCSTRKIPSGRISFDKVSDTEINIKDVKMDHSPEVSENTSKITSVRKVYALVLLIDKRHTKVAWGVFHTLIKNKVVVPFILADCWGHLIPYSINKNGPKTADFEWENYRAVNDNELKIENVNMSHGVFKKTESLFYNLQFKTQKKILKFEKLENIIPLNGLHGLIALTSDTVCGSNNIRKKLLELKTTFLFEHYNLDSNVKNSYKNGLDIAQEVLNNNKVQGRL